MKIIRINIDGSMNDITIDLKNKNYQKQLEKESISKGTTDFKELYQWKYEGKVYLCYGWYDGDAGFENKHDLIPNGISSFLEENSDEKLLFGDILMLCKKGGKFIDFCVSDYGELYNIMFGGFDNCDSEDDILSEEEEMNSDDEDFIVQDDASDNENNESDEEYILDSDEELDEDMNDY
jgi:hypothetical protein|tara:strand:- start:601 stop:1137 length:537 start_codon:yes stop_codon:yes gene_type:complete